MFIGELSVAQQLAQEANSQQKWRQLAELATSKNNFILAQECLQKAQDYGGLLLLATSSGKLHKRTVCIFIVHQSSNFCHKLIICIFILNQSSFVKNLFLYR